MAENPIKPAAAAKPAADSVGIYNKGKRPYITKSGTIEPGKSLAVTPAEAKQLLAYGDLVDASTFIPGTASETAKLRAENVELKKQLKALEGAGGEELEKAKADAADLQEKLDKALAQIQKLKDK